MENPIEDLKSIEFNKRFSIQNNNINNTFRNSSMNTMRKSIIPHITSFNEITPMYDNKGSIFNQIIRDKVEKRKNEIKNNNIFSYPINNKMKSSNHLNLDILKTFITESTKFPKLKNEKDASKYVNINNNFVNLLEKEIKKYEEIPKKPKLLKSSINTNNINSYNYNDEEYQKDFYLTQQLRRQNVEIIAPGALEQKEKAMKKIPYIIKCMEKKKNNSVYNKKMFDNDYNNRYSKQNVNIEEILMNHNMNERKGVTSQKMNNYYYSSNNEQIKKKSSNNKFNKNSLSELSYKSNDFRTLSDFSSIYLGLTSKKIIMA
jgi:hypothetical protein